jgi:hypothetical protein
MRFDFNCKIISAITASGKVACQMRMKDIWYSALAAIVLISAVAAMGGFAVGH